MGWFSKLMGQSKAQITEDDLRAMVARDVPEDPTMVWFATVSLVKGFREIAGETFELMHPTGQLMWFLDPQKFLDDRIEMRLYRRLRGFWTQPYDSIGSSYPAARSMDVATILCLSEQALVLLELPRGAGVDAGHVVWGVPRDLITEVTRNAAPHALTVFQVHFTDGSSVQLGAQTEWRVDKLRELFAAGTSAVGNDSVS